MTQESFEGFRLSLQQRRVWRLQQENPSYGAQCAVLLTGGLNTAALQEAIQHVVQRHEILRTTFHRVEGLEFPLQVIADWSTPLRQDVDLRSLSPQEQGAKFAELFRQEQRTPFDYTQGPLLRVSLLALSGDTHLLLISLPALCADVWTLTNLVQEIGHGYAAYPRQAVLPEVPVQYADFTAWQQDVLTDADGEAGRAYWRAQDFLANAALVLPNTGKPAGNAGDVPQTLAVTMTPDELVRLETMARQYDTSIDVLLLACWQLLLWRLTGQSDILVGYVCNGRKYAELQGAMGLFAWTLPIRGHFADHVPWRDVVGQLHEAVRMASAWMEYSPESHRLDTTFAVGFSFAERAVRQDYEGMSFAVQQQYSRSDRFQLHLSCERAEEVLLVEFHYDPHCFQVEAVTRLAGYFTTLLASITTAPHTPIGTVDILSAPERQQVLGAWNNTASDHPQDWCIHQLFEAQATQTPDAMAVVCDETHLTYQALHDRANRVARYLQVLGVGPEVLVGICLERSVDLVVGILGILKAGGAYVPLDPAYPRERLAFMLADAQVQVLLTQQGLVAGLPEHGAQMLCLDTDWPLLAQQGIDKAPLQSSPQNLAYVIYTSGSTGEPRGTMITQANVGHYVRALQARLGITADDRYIHTASVAFSSSVRQLLLPLAHGATVVMATTEQLWDPLALCQVIKRHEVTVLDIMPSYWRNLTNALGQLTPESRRALLDNRLRLLLSASEPLASNVPSIWATEFQHPAHLINMFGQTETTGIVAVYPIPSQGDMGSIVPIGRPIVDTQLYLLDTYLQPVPIGVPGELCVGGRGLGRGYLHRPDLTAQKFLPHPFRAELGTRLYRTGDLARYLPDGTIAFLGRLDHQVKIRGVRIEPGEIEAVLSQHPDVAAAVVGWGEAPGGDQRLVAYVVPKTETGYGPEQLSVSALRDFLQPKLPEYMLPAAFVPLAALPLTPNGKIDRQALPASGSARPALEQAFVPPRTPVEAEVARIWAEVLGRDRVGVHDNFFELGGHSLLAAQVIYRLRETFLVEFPLPSLFEAPTVAGVAAVIIRGQAGQDEQAKIARTLADIEQLSADEVHTLLAVEREESDRHDTAC
jgi:amino acid adenylation domain-containing protein